MPDIEPMSDEELEYHLSVQSGQNGVCHDDLLRIKARLDAAEAKLDGLLAILCRDGGQYQQQHGTNKAIEYAQNRVYDLQAVVEKLDKALADGDFLCDCYDEYSKKRPTAPCSACQLEQMIEARRSFTNAEKQEANNE